MAFDELAPSDTFNTSDDLDEMGMGRLVVISGVQAAGKTTVGRALAQALPRAVHIDGDAIHRFVVSGEEPYDEPPSPGALEQLLLRYSGSLAVAEVYRLAGFDAVLTDNIFGRFLGDFIDLAAPGPMHLVMLDPDAATVEERYAGRGKGGYSETVTVEGLMEQVRTHTMRVGLWLDTSDLSVEETVAQILERLDEARVVVVEEVPGAGGTAGDGAAQAEGVSAGGTAREGVVADAPPADVPAADALDVDGTAVTPTDAGLVTLDPDDDVHNPS